MRGMGQTPPLWEETKAGWGSPSEPAPDYGGRLGEGVQTGEIGYR